VRHLDLLNSFLALRFRQPGCPACLDDLGYLVQAIGVTVKLPDGSVIVPDVVTSRTDPDLTLLVEVKSGGHVELDQLRRMLNVTPEDLRQNAYLPTRDLRSHVIQVVYFCNEDHRQALEPDLRDTAVCIIGFDGERFRASGSELRDADLRAHLDGARLPAGGHPLAIIPFDDASPDEEVARAPPPCGGRVASRLGHGASGRAHLPNPWSRAVRDGVDRLGLGAEGRGEARQADSRRHRSQ
jgi:hypothetical protein